MVSIMSCDHHDRAGLVPSTRSRARMLEQLRAAAMLARAVQTTADGAIVRVRSGMRATIAIDFEAYYALWSAFRAWDEVAPSGDDWEPAVSPPSEIRVPPDDEGSP